VGLKYQYVLPDRSWPGGVVLVMFVRGVGSGEGTGEPASSPGESEGFPFQPDCAEEAW